MANTSCRVRLSSTVNRPIGLRNSSLGCFEIYTKTFQSIRWREGRACLRAILVAPSKVYSAVRRRSLWKLYALTRQSVAFVSRSELSIPLLPLLAFQMHKHFGAHLNGDLVQSRAGT